ncbi:MAG TPA: hypothetical protein VF097_11400, partial [Actinomycetota bacterium]
MRRFRLEAVLVVLLVAALALTFVLRGAPVGTGGDDDRETADPMGGATPCIQALFGEPVPGPPAAQADVASVAPVVEELRELTFEEEPAPVYLDPPALSERVTEMVEEEDEFLAIQARLLTEIGALPEGIDLDAEIQDLLGEQVGGFYDSDTGELVVADDAREGLTTVELLTLVHELQ